MSTSCKLVPGLVTQSADSPNSRSVEAAEELGLWTASEPTRIRLREHVEKWEVNDRFDDCISMIGKRLDEDRLRLVSNLMRSCSRIGFKLTMFLGDE